jgi:hypothetical protein
MDKRAPHFKIGDMVRVLPWPSQQQAPIDDRRIRPDGIHEYRVGGFPVGVRYTSQEELWFTADQLRPYDLVG